MQQAREFFWEKRQTHSPNRWHWRLLIKRLLRSSNSEVPEVPKEESSRTSHKLFQCSTTLNNIFFLALTWSFPYHTYFVIPSLSRGFPIQLPPQPRLLQAEQSSCQWPPVQAGTSGPLSSLSCPAARAKHWAWSSGRNTTTNRLGTCSEIKEYKCLQTLWALWPPDMLHKHSNNNYTTSSTTHTDIHFFPPLKCLNNDHQNWKISM